MPICSVFQSSLKLWVSTTELLEASASMRLVSTKSLLSSIRPASTHAPQIMIVDLLIYPQKLELLPSDITHSGNAAGQMLNEINRMGHR